MDNSESKAAIENDLAGNWLPILRLSIVFPILLVMTTLSFVLKLLLLPFPRHVFLRYNTRWLIHPFSKLLFRVSGTRLEVEGKIPRSRQVVVANHQGVLDSLLLMALSPCMVISSSDVRSMKVIGWVMEQLGFVFVNRTRHTSIPAILDETISMVTRSRINIGFFPEGWSNDGLELRPFRSSFFRIATASDADVLPLVFHYATINGRAVSEDEIGFFVYLVTHGSVVAHVFQLLRVRSLTLKVRIFEPVRAERIQTEQMDRKSVCEAAEVQVKKGFYQRFNALASD